MSMVCLYSKISISLAGATFSLKGNGTHLEAGEDCMQRQESSVSLPRATTSSASLPKAKTPIVNDVLSDQAAASQSTVSDVLHKKKVDIPSYRS